MKSCVCLLGLALVGCHPDEAANVAALASLDPVRRAAAVLAIGAGADADDLGYVVSRVGDPEPHVRAAVAEALGHFDDRRAADALAELAGDVAEPVQLQAVTALGQLKNPRARSYLLLAYQRDDSAVRARVAGLLEANGGSAAAAVQAEAKSLYARYARELSGTGPERLAAAEALGHSGRPEAVERLTSYLGAESHALAAAAARGLGASGVADARAPLEALLSEEDPNLQVAGAQALGELGDPAAGAALLRTVQRGGKAAIAALQALVLLDGAGRRGQSPLCEAARSPEVDLAARAGAALRRHGGQCELGAFVAALRRGAPGAAGALAGLAEIWQREPGEVLDGGAPAPGQAALPQALPQALGDLLRNGGPEVRPLAARAIGALRLSASQPELERVRSDCAAKLRRARERWVKAPLPRVLQPGFGDSSGAMAAGTPASLQAQLGKLSQRGLDASLKASEEASAAASADEASAQPSLFSPDPSAVLALWLEATLAEIRLGAADSISLQRDLAQDLSPRARGAAARAVAALPAASQWQALLPLLTDRDEAVREVAVIEVRRLDPGVSEAGHWILAQLASGSVDPELPVTPLIEALSTQHPLAGLERVLAGQLDNAAGAAAAATALVALGTPAARAALALRLRTASPVGLVPVLAAAATLKDAAVGAACRALLFHVQPGVRVAAVRAVWALDGPAAKPFIAALAGDYDVRVRRAVAEH